MKLSEAIEAYLQAREALSEAKIKRCAMQIDDTLKEQTKAQIENAFNELMKGIGLAL